MKTISFLVIALLSIMMFGCAASQKTRLATDPQGYNEAMDWMRDEVRSLNKHVVGEQYDEAVPDAERLKKFASTLAHYEPPRTPKNVEAYNEYFKQAEDLYRASDRLLYYVQQRRKADARDQLVEVANRYNRISVTYGPSIEVSVLDHNPNEFRGPGTTSQNVPGELKYNR